MGEGRAQRFIRWGEIDHKLADLKTTEIALEMQDITKKEKERIRFENLGNQNWLAVPSLLLQMHRKQTDEWSRRICQAYREVCLAQGGRISAEAIQYVFQHAIGTLFAARINAVRFDLLMEAGRTGRNAVHLQAMLEEFAREMERLKWRWGKRLEAEALECEHAESATRRNQLQEQNQRENLRKAISGRRVEIERINRTLDNLPPPGSLSQFGQPIQVSKRAIRALIQRRQEHEAALAELEGDEARLTQLETEASEVRNGGSEQIFPGTAPAAQLQKVAPGVAELSLVDLNAPIGSTLKETKHRLTVLGAPTRKLADPRILEAAEYKLRNPRCTYAEASIKFFETPGRADSIRYWVNKRKSLDRNK